MTVTHIYPFFSDQAVKTGIYFELFNYLNQHQSQNIFLIAIIVFIVQRARKPLRWFHFPEIKCLQE